MFYSDGCFDPVEAITESFDRVRTAADAVTATTLLRFARAAKLINPRERDVFLEAYPEVFALAAMAEESLERSEKSRVVALPAFVVTPS